MPGARRGDGGRDWGGDLVMRITLNQSGVLQPALSALQNAGGAVVFALKTLETADLDSAISFESDGLTFNIPTAAGDQNSRRQAYAGWLVARGFQDLMRGMRMSLEEAYVWVNLLQRNGQPAPEMGFDALLSQIKGAANRLNFPDLLNAVNQGLAEPLHWEQQFLSLQKARNCLEHRDGIVSQAKDAGEGNLALSLTFPRLQLLVQTDEGELELKPNLFLPNGGTVILKAAAREISYPVGERINISRNDFGEIALACWLMVQNLVGNLPTPEGAPPAEAAH